jgi:fatty acid desaturase
MSVILEPNRRVTPALATAVIGDILLTYGLIILFTGGGIWASGYVTLIVASGSGIGGTIAQWTLSAVIAIPIAILNSLLLHRLSLFIHSAAHWELGITKEKSDRAFTLLVAWFLGTNIDEHRTRHFAHHRKLGMQDDPEDLYSAPFSFKRIFMMITARESFGKPPTEEAAKDKGLEKNTASTGQRNIFKPISMIAHFFFVVALCLMANPGYAAMAWIVPIMIGFPIANYVRDYCEHHPFPGEPSEVARNFKPGIDAFFLGAAGFRWHQIHHETPGIHYWRLHGEAKPTATYIGTFFRLIRSKNSSV